MNQCARYFDTVVAHYEQITLAAKIGVASSAVNILFWLLLMYAAFKVRQSARRVREAAEMLASAGYRREGGDPEWLKGLVEGLGFVYWPGGDQPPDDYDGGPTLNRDPRLWDGGPIWRRMPRS